MHDRFVDAVRDSANLPVPVVVMDLSATVALWNDAATALFGWTPQEALGRHIGELTVPPGRAEQASLIMDHLASGEAWSGPFPFTTKDGAVLEMAVTATPVRVDGQVAGILCACMRTGMADSQLLVDHSADALSVHDADGTYRFASPGYRDLLGVEPAELVGVDPYTLFHPDDLTEIRAAHAAALTGRFVVQHRMRRIDGTYRWVETTGRGIPEEQAIAVATRPVAERLSLVHSLEQQRQVAEHLAQLRLDRTRFLTTVAHRARHPVTIVQGVAELLQSVLHQGKTDDLLRILRDLLPRLVANAQTLSDLVERITHSDLLNREAVQLRSRPARLESIARAAAASLLSPEASFVIEVPHGMTVFGDPQQIELAIKALVHNAIEHTPLDTAIWIRAEDVGETVVVTVADAGSGVADSLKAAIFEPFGRGDHTDPDPGLGLGLHVVAEIAALHGGHAWVEDRPGGGASFKLRFPAGPSSTRRPSRGEDQHA